MKNLSLYEKIDRVCRLGKHAIIESKDGQYMIVSPYKDRCGDWRKSEICISIEGCSMIIGKQIGDSEIGWNVEERQGWKYIGVWTPPTYEQFEIDDKVRVINSRSLYVGSIGRISRVGDLYQVNFSNIQDDSLLTQLLFNHEDLEPVFEEEEEIVEVMGKKYKKSELEERLKELKEVEV